MDKNTKEIDDSDFTDAVYLLCIATNTQKKIKKYISLVSNDDPDPSGRS